MNIHLNLPCFSMRTRDENKEAAIRTKAMKMIVKKGFDGLSMQKVARAAGVSPATIYIYYRNREDLLNSLFNEVQDVFARIALSDFDPRQSLEKGLWNQWQNRYRFIREYPMHFMFFEQFRHSPLVNHKDVSMGQFRESMHQFVKNAVKLGELAPMEPETFWALAYAPFYSLVKFHLQQRSMMSSSYELTEARMKHLLKQVIKALKP